jgi:hypothetical protein
MPSELLCIILPAIILIASSLDEHWRYRLHKRKRLSTVRRPENSCQHEHTTYERSLYESRGFITVTLHAHCTDCGQEWVEEATGSAEQFYGLSE